MSTAVAAQRFGCDACGKTFAWKPELAGKRAKCKCGASMTVPASVGEATAPVVAKSAASKPAAVVAAKPKPVTAQAAAAKPTPAAPRPPAPTPVAAVATPKPEPQLKPEPPPEPAAEDLYDLAPPPDLELAVEAPAYRPRPVAADAVAAPAVPIARKGAAVKGVTGGRNIAGGQVLGYGGRPQADRFSAAAMTDPMRDIYAPVGTMLAGFVLILAYYVFQYDLGGTNLGAMLFGVGVMTVIKAGLLFGFALVVAGPLGVSFGGIWTAFLKLAAIAVFSDGVTTWVDAVLQKGGAGGLSYVISYPVSLGVYWGLLIWLFDMDGGDSWLVVIVLSIFDRIMSYVLLALILSGMLGLGTVATMTGGGGATSDGTPAGDQRQEVAELMEGGFLEEARAYKARGRSVVLWAEVEKFYAAGAKTVWFQTTPRDINGKYSVGGILVELPTDPAKRAACWKVLTDYRASKRPEGSPPPPPDPDDGLPYIEIGFYSQV